MTLFVGQQRHKESTKRPGKHHSDVRGHPGFGKGRRGTTGVKRPEDSNTFDGNRVQERSVETDSALSGLSESEELVKESAHQFVESEEEQQSINGYHTYSRLMQSLNANFQREGPRGMKRKFEVFRPQLKSHTIEDDHNVSEPVEEEQGFASRDANEDEFEDQTDDFTKHFAIEDESDLERKICDINNGKWHVNKGPRQFEWTFSSRRPESTKMRMEHAANIHATIRSFGLKERLKPLATTQIPHLEGLSGHLALSVFDYHDILFPLRGTHNGDISRKLVCLHSLNHIFKTRDRIIKNNARLVKDDGLAELELRDQGFTRPKVLILLPTRHACLRYVETIMSLCGPEQYENIKRFQDNFAQAADKLSENKPEDFRELFAGNDDDMYRLGMKFTRKTVKFFSQFYNSDIIFASPLGLRMALGADDAKKQDHDFLSSIEIVIVDQSDAILMQNWEHVEYIFDHLNLQPEELHGCDFSRVRNWYLECRAKYLRQTIVFSAFNFPSLNKLYSQQMLNVAGKIKYTKSEEGAIIGLSISLKQTFSRFDFVNPTSEPDDRFKYFSTVVIPSLTKGLRDDVRSGLGVLVYLPTYTDFVRLRNYLANASETQHISFGSISEYTSAKDVARARSHFLSGRHSVLLYTERAHHFRRYHLKGVRKVVMYGLPENPIFYKEIVGGYLGASIAAARLNVNDASMRALFSRLDMLKLERVVGSSRYMFMLKEKGGDTFDFV